MTQSGSPRTSGLDSRRLAVVLVVFTNDPSDRALLEDLVTAAVNAAAEKARAAADESMQKATGGIKMPGITG